MRPNRSMYSSIKDDQIVWIAAISALRGIPKEGLHNLTATPIRQADSDNAYYMPQSDK